MTNIHPVTIGVVGGGWRAEFFLRIARELSDRFVVSRVLVRSDSSAQRVARDWSIPATASIADFLAAGPYDFVVVAAPREVAPELIGQLVDAGVPVLAETPPAGTLPGLIELYERVGSAPVQVAEQYQFQPHHAARLALAHGGLIGEVASARVSVAHGYHGISLIRLAICAGFEPVQITAVTLPDIVVSARGRDDWNAEALENDSRRTVAAFDFDGRTGYFDFSVEQYFSPIRARHISLYGTMGEVEDDRVGRLVGPARAAHESLYREATGADGDLEGSFLRRILLGSEVLWESRFVPTRLSDDELAGAETLQRMAEYVAGGPAFYGLADASHDQYLALLMDEATQSGVPVRSAAVPWSGTVSVASRRG